MVVSCVGSSRTGPGLDHGGLNDLLRAGLHLASPRAHRAGAVACRIARETPSAFRRQ